MQTTYMFLGTIRGYKVKIPIPVRVEWGSDKFEGAVADWQLTNDFGCGGHVTAALEDLANVIAEGFEGLAERENSLGPGLKDFLWVYREHLEKI